MNKPLVLVSIIGLLLLFVGCGTESETSEPPEESDGFKCSRIMPSGWAYMTRDEYESWLREEMPQTITGCELPEPQIQRVLMEFHEDQVSQRRWERHFEMIDVMANIRAEYRQIAADEFISPVELIYMCDALARWRVELNGITTFLDEYREAEPKLVARDSSLRTLGEETQKLLAWVGAVELRCGGN